MALIDKLTNIADAIRGKTGGTDPLTLDTMAEAIASIEAGGGGGEVDHSAEDGLMQGTLTEYHNDRITTIHNRRFSNMSNLEKVDLPKANVVRESAFEFCTKLKSVNLPALKSFSSSNHFQRCTALEFIKLPSVTKLENSCFNQCYNLKTVALPQTTLVTLASTNVFNQTPFASGGTGGTVYVPQALITEYQNATNWSTLYAAGTCNFVAIEGSEYE